MNNKFMDIAYDEAQKAFAENEVPVGAVIVKNNVIISKAHNTKMKFNNIFNHAEIIAIMEAEKVVGDWRLNDCDMYVTLEPCPMCAGAIGQSRIKKLYIGTSSNVPNNKKIIKDVLQNEDYYHFVDVEYLNEKKCSKILTDFFSIKR